MPSRKSVKQTKQTQEQEPVELTESVEVSEPVESSEPGTESSTEVDTAVRRQRSKFTSGLRRSKDTYMLVRNVVQYLASTNGQEFETMWSQVTDRDDKHFQRHFRKQRREQNPFHDIKSAIPAYSYFTKEHNSKLRAQHPDKKFGEISTMVGELWGTMPEKQKAKYHKMATEDKKRHQREIEERSRQIEKTPTEATVTEATAPEVTETTEAPEVTATTQSRSGRKSRK